jgi:hypothetical protein
MAARVAYLALQVLAEASSDPVDLLHCLWIVSLGLHVVFEVVVLRRWNLLILEDDIRPSERDQKP